MTIIASDRSKRLYLLVLLLCAGLMPSHAQAARAKFFAIGLGNSSCGAWTAARRRGTAFGYKQWMVGFLSGIGDISASKGLNLNPLNGMDIDGVLAWIDGYCLSHPIEYIYDAGGAFVNAHPN